MTDTPHRRLTYRPAIDGLRAFAVLAVLVFHLLPDVLPGGWFGVDVFFVISGFLITSLLLAEYRVRRGHVDLVAFWKARARRLLPALFLVLATVLLVAPFLTLRGRIVNVAGDVLSTLAYVANWRFAFGDEAYFGNISSPSPLRHAWSLAVEEQFYIIFPLLLVGLLSLIRRRITLVAVFTALAAGSAILMAQLHHPGLDPTRVYYGTDTRAHQLLAGAAVAAFISGGPGEVPRRHVRLVDRWCRRLALPALLVVLSAFWWAGPAQSVLFEGGLLPLSALITIVLVAATSPSRSSVQRALSWEPLRRVGVISYGLYLWHWPIIVYLNDNVLPVAAPVRVLIQICLTAVLSYVSFRFVEQPIRRQGVQALIPSAPMVGRAMAWGIAPVLIAGTFAMPPAVRTLVPISLTLNKEVTVPKTTYQPAGRMMSIMFIGNSVPKSLIGNFRNSDHPDLTLIDETNVGCDPMRVPKYADGEKQPDRPACRQWRAGWSEAVSDADPDTVVYFVAQTLVTDRIDQQHIIAFGSPEWIRLLEDHLDHTLQAAGDSHFAVMNLSCHDLPTFGSEEAERVNDVKHVDTLNDAVASWAERRDVPVLDRYSLLCPGEEYHDTLNGVPLYEDAIHFTSESAPIFWRWLAPRLQQISMGKDSS